MSFNNENHISFYCYFRSVRKNDLMIQFFNVSQLGHLIKQGSKKYQTVL